MEQRLYLDTSVFSVLDDDRSPERRDMTREFWLRLARFDACTSDVAVREIEPTPDVVRRGAMLARVRNVRVIPVPPGTAELADAYLRLGVFPSSVPEDALHVAVATLARQDVLVSWNFKHLVNQRRRAAVDALNVARGLRTIRILPPPEP
jgi:predicted nucleic acid-binding protein